MSVLAALVLAQGLCAAEPKPAHAGPPVLEMRIGLTVKGDFKTSGGQVAAAVRAKGGAGILGGDEAQLIFAFPPASLAAARERMQAAVEGLSAAGATHDVQERLLPTLEERKGEAEAEIGALRGELSSLAKALKKAPHVERLISLELKRLEGFHPEAEERRGALIVTLDKP